MRITVSFETNAYTTEINAINKLIAKFQLENSINLGPASAKSNASYYEFRDYSDLAKHTLGSIEIDSVTRI
jgi:hypothetical protein